MVQQAKMGFFLPTAQISALKKAISFEVPAHLSNRELIDVVIYKLHSSACRKIIHIYLRII